MSSIIQALPFYLNAPLGQADTSIQVRGLKDSRGNLITSMPSGVALIHVTIEPKSSTSQEIVSFTGITDNGNGVVTLTGVTRNLNPVSPFTAGTANISHANNSTCVISNNPQIFQDVVMTNEARTVTSVVTFNASPIVPTAVNAGEPVNKSQLDLAVLGTVPASSTTVLGAVRVATDPTKTLGTATMTIASPCVVSLASHGLTANDTIRFTTTGALPTGLTVGTTYYVLSTGLTSGTFQLSLTAGGTAITTTGTQSGVHTLYRTTPYALNDQDTRIAPNNHATSTGSANAYVVTLTNVPASLVKGQMYSFLSNFTNTTSATVNINSLGAKTIKKVGGATDLVSGDIASGMTVELIYDGTNMIMLNPVANAPLLPTGDGSGLTNLPNNQYVSASSSNVKISADTERTQISSFAGLSYNFVKSIQVQYSGVVSVAFETKDAAGFGGAARIYVNGVAVGTPRAGGTTYPAAFTEDIRVAAGDQVQIYAQQGAGQTTAVKNFRIRFDVVATTAGTVITD